MRLRLEIQQAANAAMGRHYREGSVDTLEFARFYLRLFVLHEMHLLVAIVTATNRFLAEPIAEELGVENLIATEPEMKAGRFTGDVSGTPSFREGKVVRVNEWLGARGQSLRDFAETWFYSDSINDAPLLGAVSHPVAVDPSPQLARLASERGWPLLRAM